jgi:hypothetical protein
MLGFTMSQADSPPWDTSTPSKIVVSQEVLDKNRAKKRERKRIKKLMAKQDRANLTLRFLEGRKEIFTKAGYPCPKWIEFSEEFLKLGFQVTLYEAKTTVSKYITVVKDKHRFKVRFSNHKPIKHRELQGDCDFFVGVTNLRTTNTRMAILATKTFFLDK